MDREAGHAAVHGVTKGQTRLSDWTELNVWMWELDCKESWALKNWCFWTVVLEKTLESPLGCKEIKPVNPKGNHHAEAEAPVLWPPDAKSWLTGKDPDDGKDWRQEEKGTTEDEMVGWNHRLHGHEFEQAPGVGDGQGSLVCCSHWGWKELGMTERLNWTDNKKGKHIWKKKSDEKKNYFCSKFSNLFTLWVKSTVAPIAPPNRIRKKQFTVPLNKE